MTQNWKPRSASRSRRPVAIVDLPPPDVPGNQQITGERIKFDHRVVRPPHQGDPLMGQRRRNIGEIVRDQPADQFGHPIAAAILR